MSFVLFFIAILIQISTLWLIFFISMSRTSGSILTIVVAIATAILSPWSLLLGLPLILISLVVMIDPLRKALITKVAYKTLANAMPSMSTTEREALDAGTSWWEKVNRTGFVGESIF